MKPKTKRWKRVYGEDDLVVRVRGAGSTKPVYADDPKKGSEGPKG